MGTKTTLAIALFLVGCTGASQQMTTAARSIPEPLDSEQATEAPRMWGQYPLATMADFDAETEARQSAEAASSALPDAPWAAAHLTRSSAPPAVMRAWMTADNRDWCAPLVPATLDGATPRITQFEGGWAVEFDKAGLPGITTSGRLCRSCGRGAFGIAGTAVMVDDEDPNEAEEIAFRDGSRLRLEVPVGDDEETADAGGMVASIKIRGQDCVYQVWSFAGDEHLERLVQELRFIDR